MATLQLAIDAHKAKTGAAEFNRATASVKRSAAATATGVTSAMRSIMGQVALIGGAGYGFSRFIKDASDAQETLSKFDVVFGGQARAMEAWAEKFGDSVGRATQDVVQWMASLQDTFVPLGFTRDRAAELSQNLVKLAVDVGSFNNASDAEVINAFTSAIVGNHEAVRRYGIILSEASLKQEALAEGLAGNYQDLTDLEKVQLRYNLILKGTTDAQGDAIRTADSFANQAKRLKANWHEVSVELGGPLMDALSGVLIEINNHDDAWKKFFKTQSEGLAEIVSGFESLRVILGQTDQDIKKIEAEAYANRLESATSNTPSPFGPAKAMPMPTGEAKQATLNWMAYQEENRYMADRLRAAQYLHGFKGPLPGTEYEWDRSKKIIEDANAGAESVTYTTLDIAQAYARMYDEIGATSEASFDARRRLLNEEIKEYEKVVKDKIVLEAYRTRQLEELWIEEAQRSQDVFAGFTAGLQEMEWEMTTLGEIGHQTASTMRDELAGAFDAVTLEGSSWRDAMKGFFTDVGKAWMRMLNQMAAEALMTQALQPAFNWLGAGLGGLLGVGQAASASSGLGQTGVTGVHVPHGGGIMGVTNFPKRLVSLDDFAHAPRFHSGLSSDEMRAIIRRNEHVLTPNQMNSLVTAAAGRQSGQGDVHIHVNNQSGVPMAMTKEQEYVLSDQRHIDVTLYALETNAGLRRAIKQVAKS